MGYLKIPNLYKDQTILLFKECYAMEKVHGTSCHVAWRDGKVNVFAGGFQHATFESIFNLPELADKFKNRFSDLPSGEVVIFGEGYGGKMQAMSKTYGPNIKFIAFDVKIGDSWLNAPKAEHIANELGFEFIPYKKISTDLTEIDRERDADSTVAINNGMGSGHIREGVVLRPLEEFRTNNGERVIVKHKRDEFRETKTPRPVIDPAKLALLEKAEAIANEWVTPMRLEHVLQKMPGHDISQMSNIISAMIDDIVIESKNEIVDSKEARGQIGRATAILYKNRMKNAMRV